MAMTIIKGDGWDRTNGERGPFKQCMEEMCGNRERINGRCMSCDKRFRLQKQVEDKDGVRAMLKRLNDELGIGAGGR